jgi:hypothetical protein
LVNINNNSIYFWLKKVINLQHAADVAIVGAVGAKDDPPSVLRSIL